MHQIYTRIMRKYASILGIDKMSTSVIRLNDIIAFPSRFDTCLHMAHKDVDNDGNWKIFLD